jgi:hypothetical protein
MTNQSWSIEEVVNVHESTHKPDTVWIAVVHQC